MDEFNRELRFLVGDLMVTNIMLKAELAAAQRELVKSSSSEAPSEKPTE